jgi:glycosyltransferase involved in cell wall biosynthesis
MKKAFVAVINDLVHDQRVGRTCDVLTEVGFQPNLFGRKFKTSSRINRDYPTFRRRLFFNKGAIFYAEINIRIFFFTLLKRFDLYYANDLDTLLSMFLISKLHRKPLIYDSHELFTEVPELKNRAVRKVWVAIEKLIFPQLKHIITVNQSIADIYKTKYKKTVHVVRNIGRSPVQHFPIEKSHGSTLQLILQGNGINKDRGAEELVLAMSRVENAKLLIIGNGDVIADLRTMIEDNGLESKVKIIGSLSPDELRAYTLRADIGFSLDKPTNDNYVYSLPNKLFDYIHCGTVVIASEVIEVKRIVEKYKVGTVLTEVTPESIAFAIQKYQKFPEKLIDESKNCLVASEDLNWESEKNVLKSVIQNAIEG